MSRPKRVMTMTLPSGMTLKIPYTADLMSFEHMDMNIRNPMLSECGRFAVDPEYYGFEPHHTGGGCMGLRKDMPNGDYFLLTDSSGIGIPTAEDADTAVYGRYTGGGTPYATITLQDVPMAGE